MTKVLSYGIVGLLAAALLGGTGYILLNPTEVRAGQEQFDGQGQGRGGSRQSDEGTEDDAYGQSRGRGNAGSKAEAPGQGQGRGSAGSEMESPGQGQGRNETERTVGWEILTGEVIVMDGEVTIQTADGEVLVGMGQSAYWESFGLAVGDEITVTGFHEDGEFKAGTVENLTTGEMIVLRDETGRPMWAGRGQLKNQDS